MAALVTTLPAMQLVCNLVIVGNGTNSALPPPGTPIKTSILPEGYIAYPEIGVAYKVYDEIVSWFVAKEKCSRNGGNLAVIDSLQKLAFVKAQRKSKDLTHVGINRIEGISGWLSAKTGLPISNIPWAPGEPNGSGNCVEIKRDENGLGVYSCIAPGDYVCEIPIPENYIGQL